MRSDFLCEQKTYFHSSSSFVFYFIFPVQQTTSGIGHRVKLFFRVGNQYAGCENVTKIEL